LDRHWNETLIRNLLIRNPGSQEQITPDLARWRGEGCEAGLVKGSWVRADDFKTIPGWPPNLHPMTFYFPVFLASLLGNHETMKETKIWAFESFLHSWLPYGGLC
jgi:hypothetical protein